VEIKCAFCGGKGKDPSRVLSPLSNCGVCGGKGTVRVEEPYETCSACLDAGAYYRSRLSCGDCSGEDAVTVKQEEEA
jgi:DnaJ-class molecular chaperone